MPAATKEVGIRLSLKDGPTVKRALIALGQDGQRALARIERASKPASKGLLALRTAASGVKGEMQVLGARFGLVGQSLSALGPGGLVAAAGVGALAIGLNSAMQAAKGAVAEIAAIKDEAETAGLALEPFQEFQHVATQFRISQSALVDGFKEMTLRADEFVVTGQGSAAEAFKRLGLSAGDLQDKLHDTPALFTEVIRAAEKLDKAAQIRISDEIFGGTGGEQFVRIMQAGAGAMNGMRKEAHELGLVLSKELINGAAETKKELDTLEKVVRLQTNAALVSLGPLLTTTAGLFADAARQIGFFVEGLRDIDTLSTTQLEKRLVTINTKIRELRKTLSDDGLRAQKLRLSGPTPAQAFLAPELADLEAQQSQLRTILKSRESIQEFNDSLASGGRRSGGVAPSDEEGSHLESLAAAYKDKITPAAEKYQKTLRDLDAAKRQGLLTDGEYIASIAKAREEFTKLEETARKTALISATDFRSGAVRGLQNIAANASNAGKQIEESLTKSFAKAEDALVNFTKTGKLDFKDLTDSILEDLTRMAIRQTIIAPLAGALGGALGGGGGGLLFPQIGHTGAVIGSSGTSRAVPVEAFSGAPRFHSGGMPGLRHDEVPFVGLRGEGVFTKAQMKALAPVSSGGGASQIQIAFSVDESGNILPLVKQVSGETAVQVVGAAAGPIVSQAVVEFGAGLGRGDFDDGMAAYGAQRQARVR